MGKLTLTLLLILFAAAASEAQSDTCVNGDLVVLDTSTKRYKCATALQGKTIDGDDNTVQDLGLSSLKTVAGDANKILHRNSSGAVISGVATVDSSGNISTTGSMTTGAGGSVAGNFGLGQGTATAVAAETIQVQAPATVTGYNLVLPGAAGNGVRLGSNSSNVVTETFVATSGTGNLIRQTALPYDVATHFVGAPAASATFRYVVARNFDSGASWAGTVCSAATAATAQTDFLLQVNAVTKATLRFAASGTTCSIVSGTTTALVAGDVITIIAPGTPDATLANIAISLKGTVN